jgi:23S rRNA pseudouridine1911/1915/1917 synthase
MSELVIRIPPEEKGRRADQALAHLTGYSRQKIQTWMRDRRCTIEDRVLSPSDRLLGVEEVRLDLPEEIESGLTVEHCPLTVLFQDEDILVLDKPRGMVVHPGAGRNSGTLVNSLLAISPLSPVGGPQRPGIVHRLDKDTSGLMVIAKTTRAHLPLLEQFRLRQVKKDYLALVDGAVVENEGRIEVPLRLDHAIKRVIPHPGGKPAVTEFLVLRRFRAHSLLECQLLTGRTHQLRVHLAYIGHPIVGDPLYGKSVNEFGFGQLLHAYRLCFHHPVTGAPLEFQSCLPADFLRQLHRMEFDIPAVANQ